MSSLSRELVFLILQFLDEEKFKETVHKWGYFVVILCKPMFGMLFSFTTFVNWLNCPLLK